MAKEVFQTIKLLWCRKRRQHKVVDDKGNHNSEVTAPSCKVAPGSGSNDHEACMNHISEKNMTNMLDKMV